MICRCSDENWIDPSKTILSALNKVCFTFDFCNNLLKLNLVYAMKLVLARERGGEQLKVWKFKEKIQCLEKIVYTKAVQ